MHCFPTALGRIQAAFDGEGRLMYLGFTDHEPRARLLAKMAGCAEPQDAAARRLAVQLDNYAAGQRRVFDIPLVLHGTTFERRVWAALLEIPFGEIRSYRELAEGLGGPQLSRAVGRANGANPVSILVPCHRLIGSDGSLTGYAGGLSMKARLLKLEGALPGRSA